MVKLLHLNYGVWLLIHAVPGACRSNDMFSPQIIMVCYQLSTIWNQQLCNRLSRTFDIIVGNTIANSLVIFWSCRKILYPYLPASKFGGWMVLCLVNRDPQLLSLIHIKFLGCRLGFAVTLVSFQQINQIILVNTDHSSIIKSIYGIALLQT